MISRVRKDDRGATLLIVLFLVIGIALVMGVVMTQVGTSVRATVGLRNESSTVYGGDAAAQYAINELRKGSFNGAAHGCDTAATETLPNFYPSVNGAQGASVSVRCTPDSSNGGAAGGGNSSPGSALLTLGTGANGEDGIWDGSVNNLTFKVSGGIFSDSNINLGNKSSGTGAQGNQKSVIEDVSTNSYIFAMGACPQNGGLGKFIITGTTTVTCNYSSNPASALDRRGMDPQSVPGHGTSFDPPAAPSVAKTPPACTGKKVYELQPGLYTDATALNALTGSGNSGSCARSIVHFNPGTYYFNFTNGGTHKWTSNAAYVVAGTPTAALDVASPPAMSKASPACVGPGTSGSSTSSGVLFVFGGDSRMDYTSSGSSDGDVEICASNAASGPPVAIYGLKSTIGSGAMQVPAESGCITATPYVFGGDAPHCALIQSYQDPTPIFTVHGTVYVPAAPIDMTFNNSSAQYFQWGLIARTILISSTGSASALANNVISVPDDAPAPFALPTYFYLDVYLCPGQSTCSASGTVSLRAKVQLSPTPPTTVKILSWSQK